MHIQNCYVSDIVPAPNSATLDSEKKSLQWSYVLQPHLPSDFELVHDFSIFYIVHMKYDRDDGVEAVTTVNVPGNRLYLTIDELDTCKRHEFAIQAVINNELQSENTSVVSSHSGRLSPSVYILSLVVDHIIQFQSLRISHRHY